MTEEEKTALHTKCLKYRKIYKDQWGITIRHLEILFRGEINGFESCKAINLNHEYLRQLGLENGKWEEKEMNHFLDSLKRCFRYDFEIEYDEEKDEHKEYRISLLIALKSYKPLVVKKSNTNNSNTSQENSPVDRKILENLKGIYYGYFYNKIDDVRNFILWIKDNREIELRGEDDYYKTGKIRLGINSVVFEFHEDEYENPELFITRIDNTFHGRKKDVTEIILAGCWADRIGNPAFGSSVLFKYYEESNERQSFQMLKKLILEDNSLADLDLTELIIHKDLIHEKCKSDVATKLANKEIHITTTLSKRLVYSKSSKKSKSP